MFAAAALSLVLHSAPAPTRAFAPEAALSSLFSSDAEAANFSAHAAWSVAVPLAGRAIDGRRGMWIAGGTWLAYSVANELLLHGPESGRERALNLTSRLGPCALVLLLDLFLSRR